VFNANYNEGEADVEEKKKKVDTKKQEREMCKERLFVMPIKAAAIPPLLSHNGYIQYQFPCI
jgi:hypothetical protein